MDKHSNDFTIRRAARHDSEELIRFIAAEMVPFGLSIDLDQWDRDIKELELSYPPDQGAFFIIESSQGQIMGCAGFGRVEGDTCKLKKMYVDRRFRRRGLAQRLLDLAIKSAITLGYRKMILDTMTQMQAAIALYEKNGFEEIECSAHTTRCDKMMQKKLI